MKNKFICLGIETTTTYLGLTLFNEQRCLASYFKLSQHKQSDQLFIELTQLFKKTKVKKHQISLVAVDIGPGSFTGVRVGVTTARAFGQALQIPVVGVCSLEALAFEKMALGTHQQKKVMAVLPALAGEVYYAIYRADETLTEIEPPKWASEKQWKQTLLKHSLSATPPQDIPPHVDTIAKLGIQKFYSQKNKKRFHYENCSPLYLQPSWAERKKQNLKI